MKKKRVPKKFRSKIIALGAVGGFFSLAGFFFFFQRTNPENGIVLSAAGKAATVSRNHGGAAVGRVPASFNLSENELKKMYAKKTADWLMDALKGNAPEKSQAALIAEAKKNPVVFAKSVAESLGEIPLENFEIRDSSWQNRFCPSKSAKPYGKNLVRVGIPCADVLIVLGVLAVAYCELWEHGAH